MRIVKRVLPAVEVDMGGFPVLQPFPTVQVEQIDPFLLFHHAKATVPAGRRPNDVGIGPHPHRGFSPVTFVFKGDVHHRDSRGNSQVVSAGGVQWMSAGMGIIHSERPSKEMAENGGEQEIIQLWINTPAAKKMDQPKYFAVQKADMPRLPNLEGDVRLVSGIVDDLNGPVVGEFPVLAIMGELEPGDELSLTIKKGNNAFLYVLGGSGNISGFGLVEERTLYQFEQELEAIHFHAKDSMRFVFLSAAPLKEKVEHYGPFVMNNQTQIMEAMRDYQMGKMGFLVEEFD